MERGEGRRVLPRVLRGLRGGAGSDDSSFDEAYASGEQQDVGSERGATERVEGRDFGGCVDDRVGAKEAGV